MHFYRQAAISLGVLAVGAGAWLFLAPDGRAILAKLNVIDSASEAKVVAPMRALGGGRGITVVTATVSTASVNDRLTAIGDGKALQSVTLMPEESGTITKIMISSGNTVKKGDVIVQLDDRQQTLARDQADVALQSAARQANVNRKIKSAISETEVYNAEIAEQSAKLDLETAELALSRREVLAPFSGIAGIVPVNVGDYVTSSTALVTIDDRSVILVDFAVPERFATAIERGQTVSARPISASNKVFEGTVEAVDNRIDAASRTFTVRARIDNAADNLRAGMSFDVTMKFVGNSYPAVDPLAIQWDADGAYVWGDVDGKAHKVRVSIVQRNPDYVLVDAALSKGDPVIIEGLQRLREGVSVHVDGAQPDTSKS